MGMFDRQPERERIAELLERDGAIVVSEGTLRDLDLIDKFRFWVGNHAPVMTLNNESYFEYLFNQLEEMAPDGYYFGAHEGDGACYGFFPSLDPAEMISYENPEDADGDPTEELTMTEYGWR